MRLIETQVDSDTLEYNYLQRKKNETQTLQVCTLASGSKGNSIFVSDGETAILFDAGLSGKEIERRLASRELLADRIDAIVVSHEHTDHIQGVGVLSRRYKIPVYLSRQTYQAAQKNLGKLTGSHFFACGSEFRIGALAIHPFSLSHDAIDPAGFTVRKNGVKLGIATDLGIATAVVREHLKESNVLILEANHDREMLLEGPYPWSLKQRVQSRSGHLSNMDAGNLLGVVLHEKLQHVILAHLSETNNTPEKAYAAVDGALQGKMIPLTVALQDRCSGIIQV